MILVLGVFVAVVVIAAVACISYILASRQASRATVRWWVHSRRVLEPSDALLRRGLSLKYKSKDVTYLTSANVALWIGRGRTVRSEDRVEAAPLLFQIDASETFVGAKVVSASRPHNKVRVRVNPHSRNEARIYFDYLEPGDGFVLRLLSSGTSQPSLRGELKGSRFKAIKNGILSDRRLASLTSSSKLARVFEWIKARWAVLLTLPTGLMGIVAATYSLLTPPSPQPASLVNPSGYDLATLQGQQEFSEAVLELGMAKPEFSPIIYYIIAGVMIFFGIALCNLAYHSWFPLPPRDVAKGLRVGARR